MRILASAASLSVLTCVGSASAATFYQRAVVDLAPITAGTAANDVGTNVSAVAWDGTNAYLAGFNGGTVLRDTALVNVSDVLTTPAFGSRYGVFAGTASGGRGYTGADFKTGVGMATTFDGGTASTTFARLDNVAGTQVFQVTASNRPAAGPSFDTLTARLSYMVQGTNLLRNLDVANGTQTGTPNTNIGTVTANGTVNRDLDFDSAGNLYIRNNNDVIRANRLDAASYTTSPTVIANLTDANAIGTNIATLESFGSNPLFAIYNDKASNANGQLFSTVVKAKRADGTDEALSFLTGDGLAASPLSTSTGTAFYDFSYDAGTKTLALLDYTNRQLYIFGATSVPEPTTLAALAGTAVVALRRRRK